MSNRNSLCDPKKFSTPINRSQTSMNDPNRYRLPAIQQTATQSFLTPKKELSPIQPTSNLKLMNCDPTGPAARNASTPSYQNCKTNSNPCGPTIPGLYNHLQQTPANRGWSSNEFVGFGKRNMLKSNAKINDNSNCSPGSTMPNGNGFRSSTSKMNVSSNGQKLVCRDRQLANEILQKAGISSNLPATDALEVISDEPVGKIDMVNCDPNPVCMRKPAEHPVIFIIDFERKINREIDFLRNVMNNRSLFVIYIRNVSSRCCYQSNIFVILDHDPPYQRPLSFGF